MESIPFGVERLDAMIGGGAPPGTVVLCVGEPGAGGREFVHTCAAMNALSRGDPDLFDLHYGEVAATAAPPPGIHYISFTSDEEFIEREMAYTMDEEIVDAAARHIDFRDFAPEYFQLSPIPREWYVGETQTVQDLGQRERLDDVLESMGDYLNQHAPGNLVVVDSLTDLVASISEDMTWSDIAMLMKGLSRASHRWGGLILLLVNEETLKPTELGHLMEAAGGTIQFRWESGGSQRARTMVVREFRGVLSRIEAEDIVRFETTIGEAGFDVSDVRKIR
jgi:KaiC/GvpD/RAD55 family RecA-like ATPase